MGVLLNFGNLDAMIAAKDGIGLSPTEDKYICIHWGPRHKTLYQSVENLFILYEGNLNLTLIKSLLQCFGTAQKYIYICIPGTTQMTLGV